MTRKFNVTGDNADAAMNLKPPYVVLANHSSVLDPFFLNKYIPGIIHYVVSDANFRNPVVNLGLSLVGSIPKTKAISDTDTIRHIMRVTRNRGIVGIFPEGQSSWDGASLPIVSSTAKLLKILKVPVLIGRLSGAFLSKPRWSRRSRRGRITIRYDIAFDAAQIKSATVSQIDERIRTLLTHNDFEANRTRRQRFVGRDRAEYMEIALFVCPSCESIGTLCSHGNVLRCESCGYAVKVDLYGFFRAHRGELQFDNMHDWNLWQSDVFVRQLDGYQESGEKTPFLFEEQVDIHRGFQDHPLEPVMRGSIALFGDRVDAEANDGTVISFPLDEIRGANIQNKERMEFYVNDTLYRVVSCDPRGCTYKWDLAIRHMQANRKSEQNSVQ
jgi:1-acyl-sn-glycerol-3-phosphate acyltransferase